MIPAATAVNTACNSIFGEHILRDVAVLGVGMTHFGKRSEVGIKQLVNEAVNEALIDAGIDKKAFQAAYVGNAAAGAISGQHMIRGQVVLAPMGIANIPIYNVENACASSSYAFNLAWQAVATGIYDCVLAVGFEKLYDSDKTKSFRALESGLDVLDSETYFQRLERELNLEQSIFRKGGEPRSRFVDVYAFLAQRFMSRHGLTRNHLAMLAVKAHLHGSLNPKSQYQERVTLEQVLASGDISYPLTRMMCAPVGDGGSAAILCSTEVAAKTVSKPIWVSHSLVSSGVIHFDLDDTHTRRSARELYEVSGIGPEDIDLVELHDTTSPAEIMYLEEMGFCDGQETARLIEDGYFGLDGKICANPSGGLTTKGHPVGATGLAQIYEVVNQLRGRAGKRQVAGATVGMTHNGGGLIGLEPAAMALHLFRR